MKDGAPVGAMGKAEFLKLFAADEIGSCFTHRENLYRHEWDEEGDKLQARQLNREA
jgi:hypothetical protein